MQSENRFFDDLARVASGAMGALAGLRAEFETLVRQRFERMLADMDLVQREQFEATRAMAAKARAEQEDLQIRLGGLEARLGELELRLAALEPAPAERPARPRRAPKPPEE